MLNAGNSFIIRGLRILCLASLVGDRWWTWSPDESQVDTFRPSYMSTQIFYSDIQTLLYVNSDILDSIFEMYIPFEKLLSALYTNVLQVVVIVSYFGSLRIQHLRFCISKQVAKPD